MKEVKNELNIGFFTDDFPSIDLFTGKPFESYISGGVGEVVYNLAIEMEKRGHVVYIFTNKKSGNTTVYNYSRIHILRYKSYFSIGMTLISPKLILAPFLSEIKLDVIHVHMGTIPAAIAGYLYSKYHKIPMVITHHGDIITNVGNCLYRNIQCFCGFLSNILLKKSDKIIGLSRHHISGSINLKKYQDKIVIIPNGINPSDYHNDITKEEARKILNLPSDKKIILFVGTLVKNKGLDLLIKAINVMKYSNLEIQLIIIGDGLNKQELIILSKFFSLEKVIFFKGFISNTKEKVLYYKAADIFVLPSYSEAYPITLLEASAAGLPLISSNLECIKAIVQDGENGLLFTPGDEYDLSEKILTLLQNNELRIKLGNKARQNVKDLSWRKIAEKTEETYMEVKYV